MEPAGAAKFAARPECRKVDGKAICRTDMAKKATILATFGADAASYTTTTPSFTGSERQSNSNCFYDLDGRAFCS